MPRKVQSPASRVQGTETPQTEATSESVDLSRVDAPIFKIRFKDAVRPKSKKKGGLKRKFETNGEHQEETNRVQDNPFKGTNIPTTLYHVEPKELWLEARTFNRFTISNETFDVGDMVFVRPDDEEDPDPNAPIQGWVAKVLEVRAHDSEHVYLRVYWMYRPEDLPGGRQPYHGQNELIASNDMQVIDATTVEAKAVVRRWEEQEDKNEVLNGDELFWRQTLDVMKPKTKQLSKLSEHCIDKTPCNPDGLLIQCAKCKNWLHGTCIEQAAVREAYQSHNIDFPGEEAEPPAKKRKTGAKKQAKSAAPRIGLAHKLPSELLFSAKIENRDSQTVVVVTDHRSGKSSAQEVPLKCLLCEQEIESGGQDSESEVGVSVQAGKDRAKKDSVVKEEDGE